MKAGIVNDFKIRVTSSKCPLPRFSITIEALSPEPLGDAVKILAFKFPPSKAIYSQEQRAVTLRIFDRMIGIYENGLITFCAENLEEAKNLLKKIVKIIREAQKEAIVKGVPDIRELEKWSKLNPLELYNYLPKANCGKCGEKTCIAFAAKVLSGEKKLEDCNLLRENKYSNLVKKMIEKYGNRIVEALGWKKITY
ncbi:MAG: hypothetical protein DRJ38_10050 [Thermoprotei archaeon]|nr:MAG: hypothetical protein DRJ38_10050 [Thermoprotei archaeon]